jgi:hypothetical protein
MKCGTVRENDRFFDHEIHERMGLKMGEGKLKIEEKAEWEKITKSYERIFQVTRSLEKQLPFLKENLESLKDKDLIEIKNLMNSIADQWDDRSKEEKRIASMNNIKEHIEILGKSKNKDEILEIFRSFAKIPPVKTIEEGKARTNKSPKYCP